MKLIFKLIAALEAQMIDDQAEISTGVDNSNVQGKWNFDFSVVSKQLRQVSLVEKVLCSIRELYPTK